MRMSRLFVSGLEHHTNRERARTGAWLFLDCPNADQMMLRGARRMVAEGRRNAVMPALVAWLGGPYQ